MTLTAFDLVFFAAFFIVVVGFSLWKSRGGGDSSDYFLGGRSLPWWLIGISIVAANISTEQMVAWPGRARAGIYTTPEFLEYRYNSTARALMALITVVIYVGVLVTAVLYSGGLTMQDGTGHAADARRLGARGGAAPAGALFR